MLLLAGEVREDAVGFRVLSKQPGKLSKVGPMDVYCPVGPIPLETTKMFRL